MSIYKKTGLGEKQICFVESDTFTHYSTRVGNFSIVQAHSAAPVSSFIVH